MPTRFPALSVVAAFGVLVGSAQEATAQDVDPQKAAACMQAVDGANYEQVLAACPEVLEVLPEDHPYYAHWAQTVNYAYSLQCQPAFEAQQRDSVIAYCQMAVEAGTFFTDEKTSTIREWGLWVAGLAVSLMVLEWWVALRGPRGGGRPTPGLVAPLAAPPPRGRP